MTETAKTETVQRNLTRPADRCYLKETGGPATNTMRGT